MKPSFSSRALAIVLLAIFIVPVTSTSQEKPQDSPRPDDQKPWRFSVGANLVIVPVIVRDKHGEHVSGLEAEDFEVKEEGAIQKIAAVDEISASSAQEEKTVQKGAHTFSNVSLQRPKKLVIIALDQMNTPFQSATDGHRSLVEFLSKNVDENTLIALVAFQHNGIRIIHDFTSSPSVLVAAIQKVKATITSRDTPALNALGDNSQADMEALQLTALLNGASSSGASTPAELLAAARAGTAAQRAQVDASRQAQEALITLEDFQQVAQYFWGVPGRKSLIWASTGFPFALGAAAQSSTRGTIPDDWQRTFRMLTDANISVYPVDIGGLLPGANANNIQSTTSALLKASGPEGGVSARTQQLSGVESGAFLDPTAGRHETMRQVADMTGGQPFYNSNDVSGLFRQASQDASQYYMLSYYTKNTSKSGWRKLNVKVHRDNVRIRARSGFFFHDPAGEPEAVRQSDEMLAMASDLGFSALPLTGTWEKIDLAGNERKVHFLLSVPAGVPFVDNEHNNHINFDFRAVATDSSGRIAAKIGERLETNLPPEGLAQIRAKGLDYANSLSLAPGHYTVHFVVRDNLKGMLGSMVVPLQVE